MIGQVRRPIEEILGFLVGKEKVVLHGCDSCATAIAPPFGEFICYAPGVKKVSLSKYRQEIEQCEAILTLSCGDGLQIVREFVLENKFVWRNQSNWQTMLLGIRTEDQVPSGRSACNVASVC